jgi:hypothetical protein
MSRALFTSMNMLFFGSDPQLRANCEGTEDHTACKAMFPEAYAITYWTHSWEDSTTASTKKAA